MGWDATEYEWDLHALDMNCTDYGALVIGLDDNYAFGTLIFSGNYINSQWYRLESDISLLRACGRRRRAS